MSEREAIGLAGCGSGDTIASPVGPDIMATLRGPGTVALKRRPGTTGAAIDEALTAIDKERASKAWAPWHGQGGDFFEEEAPSGITRPHRNAQPPGQGRQGSAIKARWYGVR
jgi:hypothetical protein